MKKLKVLVGITGGIAAYKTCDLVRTLVKNDHEVRVVMTRSATEFVTPLTFEVLSRNPVPLGLFDRRGSPAVEHVASAQWAECVAIAPATASIIGKLASGIADDLLTTLLLAVPAGKPIVLAPAMNTGMWENPIVVQNLKKLVDGTDGRYSIVPPVVKELACGDLGMGGMAPVEEIYSHIIDVADN